MKLLTILKRRKGLTLAEVLLVLFIIAVLVAIPFWGGSRYIARNRLRNEAIKIKIFLEDQRTTAMAMSTRRGIEFTGGGYDVIIKIENLNHPQPNLDSLYAQFPGYISRNVRFGGLPGAQALGGGTIEADGITFTQNRVIFTAFGLCETPGEIYINDGRNLMCISVNSLGQVRVFRWAGGGAWYEEK